ncbi:hypothetical protein BKA61DRAFT_656792 [Leptodontidium sp. MPI-SDFR-AT-0119]|nr:hypothetical protein BKA61DRAFT_656792 [Leptodontidium sp. MPI-SDFR-AT-0119]
MSRSCHFSTTLNTVLDDGNTNGYQRSKDSTATQSAAPQRAMDVEKLADNSVLQSKEAAPSALPTVYLCRHAEPTSKIWDKATGKTEFFPLVVDPELTTRGEHQCRATAYYLSHILPDVEISVTLSSPLSRALDTAKLVFEPLAKTTLTVVAVPELQTLRKDANGTGMDLADLKTTYGKVSKIRSPPNVSVSDDRPRYTKVDLDRVTDGWNNPKHKERRSATDPGGKYSEGGKNVESVKAYLDHLSTALPQPVSIAVVTHSSVLSHWIAADGWITAVVKPGGFHDFDDEGILRSYDKATVFRRVSGGKYVDQPN